MTEDEAAEAMAYCAVLDFKMESHFMKLEFPNDGVANALVVYRLNPLGQCEDHAIVMQYHKGTLTQPQADFYRDLNTFKVDMLDIIDQEKKGDES